MKYIFKYTLALLLLAGLSTGCNDFLEPSVDQELPISDVIQSEDDLESIVLGAHDDLNSVWLFGRDFYVDAVVRSDDAFSNGNSGRFDSDHSGFNFTVNNTFVANAWAMFYQSIAAANLVINDESVENSPRVEYIKGQAYALRAFSHLNLLIAYGQPFVAGGDPNDGIPYVTTYNEGNLYPPRDPIADVWNNIGADLQQAVSLMSPAMDSQNPVYMGYFGARALQSRYYLYTEQWDEAIAAADDVINNGGYSLVDAAALVDTWASGSGPNSIFELAFTSTDGLPTDNIARIYRDTNYGDIEATEDLYNAYDANDARLDLFSVEGDTIRMNGKYVQEASGSDNVRIIRYAEVLLNKAEALAYRNTGSDRSDALDIINDLSATRGSSTVYTSGTPDEVLAERRLELAFEGQRLYDLARNEMDIPHVTVPARGTYSTFSDDIEFGDYRYHFPIPQSEINANSSMTQNEGYR